MRTSYARLGRRLADILRRRHATDAELGADVRPLEAEVATIEPPSRNRSRYRSTKALYVVGGDRVKGTTGYLKVLLVVRDATHTILRLEGSEIPTRLRHDAVVSVRRDYA